MSTKMILRTLLGLTASLSLCVAPDVVYGLPMEAGVAVMDITPPIGYRMSGYFYERPSTGTHDPLQAKAIVLRQGDRQAALVFCDLIGISLDVSGRARRLAEQETGIPASNIMIAATHSHTGPLYFGALRQHFHDQAVAKEDRDPYEKIDYAADLVGKLVKVIADARAAVGPVELYAGSGQQQDLSFNRRFHMKSGPPVRFNPGKLNPDILRPAGPIDPDVGILLVRGAGDGRPRASLAVFALHLDTVGGTEYGADFPFYLSESLRKELGEKFVSVFANGTCGDINHLDVSHKRSQAGQEEARRIGENLAATVKARLPELKDVEKPSLGVRTKVIEVPLQRYGPADLAWARETMKQVASPKVPFLDRVKAYKITALELRGGRRLPMTVQALRIGRDVAIVALPGEVFVDLGLAIKRASPFAVTMVVELAHDAPGYVPTRKAFAEGSYETVNSRIQPGGGERLVETAVALLKELKAE